MGERGVGPAGEHGGHPVAAAGELRAAYGVDGAVDAVQPATGRSVADSSCTEAKIPELPERDHAVLSVRKRRNLHIQRKLNTKRTRCGRNVLSLILHRYCSVPGRR
jgi:hypothetical protein